MREPNEIGRLLHEAVASMGGDKIDNWAHAMLASCIKQGKLIALLKEGLKVLPPNAPQHADTQVMLDMHEHITAEVEKLVDLVESYRPAVDKVNNNATGRLKKGQH